LADATVKANIGAGNILTAAATAAASLPICKWLEGQQVCASSYDTLSSSIATAKANFHTASDNRNAARWGNVDTNINVNNCLQTAVYAESFVAYSILAEASGNATIDYSTWAAAVNAEWTIEANSSDYQTEVALVQAEQSQISTYKSQYISGKANCSASVFAWVIYVNCLATDANYATKLSGTGSNLNIFVQTGTCQQYITDCMPYFTASSNIAGAALFGGICNNDDFSQVQSDLSGTFSASVNTDLNSLWATIKNSPADIAAVAQFGGGDGGDSGLGTTTTTTTDVNAYVGLECGSDDPNAEDCNFICNNVLTSTGVGYKINAFLNLDASSSTRRLLQNNHGPQETPSGPALFTVTANEDTTVADDNDPLSGSNASKLFLSLALFLGLAFLL